MITLIMLITNVEPQAIRLPLTHAELVQIMSNVEPQATRLPLTHAELVQIMSKHATKKHLNKVQL